MIMMNILIIMILLIISEFRDVVFEGVVFDYDSLNRVSAVMI